MNTINLNSEKGQAIIYLVLGIVVFLGFVALAIDGGMVLADRRDAQNATDASALAGASAAAQKLLGLDDEFVDPATVYADCRGDQLSPAKNDAEVAAKGRATSNNYTIIETNTPDVPNTVYVECGIDDYNNPFMDVSVEISKTTTTSFLQVLVPHATLTNSMKSVARLHTATTYGEGSAIVALNPSDKCSMETGAGFSGNTLVNIFGGGIFTNGCLDGKGSADVNVEHPYHISYWYDNYSDGVFDPPPTPVNDHRLSPPIVNLTPDDCNQNGAKSVASLPEELTPGLWCVTDSKGVKITGGTYTGTDVTIYILNGDLKITGGSVNLFAPVKDDDDPDKPLNNAYYGLLFYVPNGLVDLTGNNDSTYQGSILAPNDDITVNGNGTSDCFHSQLIGYNVKLNGTSLFEIRYDPNENLNLSATIDLYR
jgi:Flp pilus assembly protein TadG